MNSKRSEMIIDVDSDDDFIDTRQNRSIARQKAKNVNAVIIPDNNTDSESESICHEPLDLYESNTVVMNVKDNPSFRSQRNVMKSLVHKTKRPITPAKSSVLECPNRGNVNNSYRNIPRLNSRFESARAISTSGNHSTSHRSTLDHHTGPSDSACYGRTKRPIKAEQSLSLELSHERDYIQTIQKEPISNRVSALVPVTESSICTRSSSLRQESDQTKGSESVLERSMSCFQNRNTDPRILAINAKTKDMFKNLTEQLNERSKIVEHTRGMWEECFEKWSSIEREEEWTSINEENFPEDWEEAPFISYYDRTMIEAGLLLDTDSSDDEDLDIVDPEDDIQRSINEPHGKDLAQYISEFSKINKSALGRSCKSESQDNKSLVHISGSMSSELKSGQFSSYRNSVRMRVYGLQLEFSRDYLATLKAMTGQDLRRCAYEISFIMDDTGVTSTFKELDDSRQLKNPSLVNESHASELNISLRNKRLLHSMLTPKKVKQERLEKSHDATRCSENSFMFNKTTSLNESSLNKSTRFTALFNMLAPKKIKQEVKQEKSPDCYQDRCYRDPTSSSASLLDTSHNASRCEKRKQFNMSALEMMLTPSKPSKPNCQSRYAFLGGLSRSAGTSNSSTNSCSTSLKGVSERWRSNPDLGQTAMSPMKRNHDVDTTNVDSPSKRHRFNNDSVLSSTRIEDTSFVSHPRFDSQCDNFDKPVSDRPSHSHHIQTNSPVPHREYYPTKTYTVNRNDSHYQQQPYYPNYPAVQDQYHQQHYSHYPHQVYAPPHYQGSCCAPPRHHHAPHYPPHHHHHHHPVYVPSNRHQTLGYRQNNVPPAPEPSKRLVASKGSTAVPIQVPIVTDILKGLNSHDRKLNIRVDYEVKLANDEDKESSF